MKWFPDRKVLAGGIGGVVAWVAMFALQRYAGITLTPDMQTMLVGGITTALAYIVPPSTRDIIKRLDDGLVAMAIADPNIPVTGVPPKQVTTTVVSGMTGRVLSVPIALVLLLPLLAACNTAKATTEPGALQQAVADAKAMTPEQKYLVACNTADGLILAYRAFVAEKQSPTTNARVEAAYAALQPFCVSKPENYATALIALVQSLSAFKAALPKAA